jgi:hypothetical protein
VHTNNPFADDPDVDEALNAADSQPPSDGPRAAWGRDAAYRPSTSEFAAHSLEHLAAAASDQYPYNAQPLGAVHSMIPTAPHYTPYHAPDKAPRPASTRRARLANPSPSTSYPSNNNISSILNHTNTLSPVIDPSLQSGIQRQPTTPDPAVAEKGPLPAGKHEGKAPDDHEMAALLRGIAEDHPPQRDEGALG